MKYKEDYYGWAILAVLVMVASLSVIWIFRSMILSLVVLVAVLLFVRGYKRWADVG